MSMKMDEAALLFGPPKAATAPRKVQRLDGTGTAEKTNSTALQINAYATFISDTDVYFALTGSSAGTGAVTAANAAFWPANVPFQWYVQADTKHIRIEAKDGSSAFDAMVWTSGAAIYGKKV